ncbi:MAG: alpha/beta fold hydrolase, partial [bacterium]
ESVFIKKGSLGCLLLHGFSSTPREFFHIIPKLSQEKITVSVPLLPGHGTKPEYLNKTSETDFINFTEDAYKNLKKICSKILVVGSSFGGALAIHLASKYDVMGLILLAPLFKIRKESQELFSPELKIKIFNRILKYKKKTIIGKVNDVLSLKNHIAYDTIPLIGLNQALKIVKRAGNKIIKIYKPFLLFHSENDSVADFNAAVSAMESCPAQTKEINRLTRSDHVLCLDYDREFIFKRMVKFIQRISDSNE